MRLFGSRGVAVMVVVAAVVIVVLFVFLFFSIGSPSGFYSSLHALVCVCVCL